MNHPATTTPDGNHEREPVNTQPPVPPAHRAHAVYLLARAASVIEQNGLLRGDLWPGHGPDWRRYEPGSPCCAIGALCVAAGIRDAGRTSHALVSQPALRAALGALDAEFGGTGQPDLEEVLWRIGRMNDRHGRTAAEVTAVLRAAARRMAAEFATRTDHTDDTDNIADARLGGPSAKTSHPAGSPNHQTDSKEAPHE